MLQEHGLGARPYDCSKCTLKFFFRAELDHHVLTFHRSGGAPSPTENAQNSVEAKPRDPKEQNSSEGVMVKEEVLPDAADEEEEINVDEQVEQDDQEADKRAESEQEMKIEVDEEAVPAKTES